MSTIGRTVAFMLGLIALYLLIYYSGGSSNVLGTLGTVTVNETKALQGR